MLRSRRWGIGPLRAHACKCLRLPPLRPLGIQRMNQRSSGSPNSGLSLMHLACPDALGPAERQPERAADRRPRVRMPQGPARLLKHGFVREWQVPSPILFSKRTTSPRVSCYPADKKQPRHREAGAKPVNVSFRLAAESSQPAILTTTALIANFRYAQYGGSHTTPGREYIGRRNTRAKPMMRRKKHRARGSPPVRSARPELACAGARLPTRILGFGGA